MTVDTHITHRSRSESLTQTLRWLFTVYWIRFKGIKARFSWGFLSTDQVSPGAYLECCEPSINLHLWAFPQALPSTGLPSLTITRTPSPPLEGTPDTVLHWFNCYPS